MVPILAALWPSLGCKADLPMQLANDASGDFPCTVFADQLISYNPPGTEGGSELGGKTLGAPDGETVILEKDAVLTVAFVGLGSVVERSGNDVQVHGGLDPGAQVAVYVATTDGGFVYSGSLGPDAMAIDISVAAARTAASIQLIGIEGQATIDAFESLQTTCP